MKQTKRAIREDLRSLKSFKYPQVIIVLVNEVVSIKWHLWYTQNNTSAESDSQNASNQLITNAMKKFHHPITRFIICDGKGSNKVCYWYSDVEQWLKDYGLTVVRQEQFYAKDYNTTYVYVTNK